MSSLKKAFNCWGFEWNHPARRAWRASHGVDPVAPYYAFITVFILLAMLILTTVSFQMLARVAEDHGIQSPWLVFGFVVQMLHMVFFAIGIVSLTVFGNRGEFIETVRGAEKIVGWSDSLLACVKVSGWEGVCRNAKGTLVDLAGFHLEAEERYGVGSCESEKTRADFSHALNTFLSIGLVDTKNWDPYFRRAKKIRENFKELGR